MLFDNIPGKVSLSSYSAEQMHGRSEALALASALLRNHPAPTPESLGIADELLIEAQRWSERAEKMAAVLTSAQRRTYDNILKYISLHGESPTIKELGMMDGVVASAVKPHLVAMVKKGVVAKVSGIHRGITILKEL